MIDGRDNHLSRLQAPATAADKQGWGRRESVIQKTLDLRAAVMFKIVLALSLVDRRSSRLSRNIQQREECVEHDG